MTDAVQQHVTAYVSVTSRFDPAHTIPQMEGYVGREQKVTHTKASTATRIVAVVGTEIGYIPVAAWRVKAVHRDAGSYVRGGRKHPLVRFLLASPLPVLLTDHTVPTMSSGIAVR